MRVGLRASDGRKKPGRSAADDQYVSEEVRQRAKILESRGFRAYDALHIASAEAGKVDFFCTCDDRVLKKSRQQTDLTVRVVSPLELANEVQL